MRAVLDAERPVPDARGTGGPRGAGAPLSGRRRLRLRQVQGRQVRNKFRGKPFSQESTGWPVRGHGKALAEKFLKLEVSLIK